MPKVKRSGRMNWQEVGQQVLQHPKTGAAVAGATTSTGLASILEVIPDNIAKLAAVIGIFLSCMLIYVHWLRAIKVRLEIRLLQTQMLKNLQSAKDAGYAQDEGSDD